jgi:hypothetical protein
VSKEREVRIVDGRIRTEHVLDNAITLPKLPDGVLTADAAGRAKMADGFLTLAKILDGIFTADAAGRAKFASGFVDSGLVLDASLVKGDLAADTVQWAITIPLMVSAASVAADAVGTPKFGNSLARVRAEHLQSAKSAYVVLDYAWAATADGTIQVYDNTALAVIAETATLVGGEVAEYAELAATLANIVAGNDIIVRANVTTAGAAGETATVNRAWLVLVCGAS